MDEHESKNNKRKESNNISKPDKKKEKQANTRNSEKLEGDNQTEKEKIETPENSEAKICLSTKSDKDVGGSRTSTKINVSSLSKPEIAHEMEADSGSDSKMLTEDKHIDNKEVILCSQTTTANGASAGDPKTDDERKTSVSESSQKVKKSGSASYDRKVHDIQQLLGGSKQSAKVDKKDTQSSRGGQWSGTRGSDSRQDQSQSTSMQGNSKGYVKRAHSAEKSIDPTLHSAHFLLSGKRENFHFFFKRQCPFSQHYMSEFKVDEVTYNCCEQFMMQQKALTFQDEESAKKIMSTSEPNVQKRFGRLVKNFDGEVWNKVCMDVVKKANMAKFSQNPKLKEILLKTGSKVLVEASPYDRIWGIGLAQDHADAPYPEHWLGENRLGRILMEVRDELSKDLKPK